VLCVLCVRECDHVGFGLFQFRSRSCSSSSGMLARELRPDTEPSLSKLSECRFLAPGDSQGDR
jgi:hypothetical protein